MFETILFTKIPLIYIKFLFIKRGNKKMKANQIILKWQKKNDKFYEVEIPNNVPSDFSLHRVVSKKELKIPFRPAFGYNSIILNIGHDFRRKGNFLITSNLDIVDSPLLLEWGDDVPIICKNNHKIFSDIALFCDECGEPLN